MEEKGTNEKFKIGKAFEKKRQAVKSMKDIREEHKTKKDERSSTELIRHFREEL